MRGPAPGFPSRGAFFRSAARGDKWHVRRSGKALAATRHKRGSAPAVLARRRCACAGLGDGACYFRTRRLRLRRGFSAGSTAG
ncbi:hypothetical protein DMQ72_23750 [Klebsiella quasipneumoniae]|nr:hypothetical protein DMQ72_23750 [Klebsiella quasipneumoniae]